MRGVEGAAPYNYDLKVLDKSEFEEYKGRIATAALQPRNDKEKRNDTGRNQDA